MKIKLFIKSWERKKDKVYTIKFWDQAPKDWQGKWSEGMGDGIMDGFIIK